MMSPLLKFVVALCAFFMAGEARAQADFYRGKQIRMVVGTAAGQDYDIWARLIGRHMQRHVPGNPAFLTENMPGGGHLVATNYLFNSAPRDGTALGMVSRNITDAAILKFPNVRFDPEKFNWIGSPEINHRVLLAATATGIASARDLFTRELVVGAPGIGQAVTTAPILLRNALGMKLKIVLGYSAPEAVVLAMQRGEVGGLVESIGAPDGSRRKWIDSGLMRVLFSMEPTPVEWLGAPTVFDFVQTPEQRRIFEYFASNQELGRPVMAPPGVPGERVQTLRRAFDATLRDPEFLREAKALGFEVTPRAGEAIEKLVAAAAATPKDVLDLVARAATLE